MQFPVGMREGRRLKSPTKRYRKVGRVIDACCGQVACPSIEAKQVNTEKRQPASLTIARLVGSILCEASGHMDRHSQDHNSEMLPTQTLFHNLPLLLKPIRHCGGVLSTSCFVTSRGEKTGATSFCWFAMSCRRRYSASAFCCSGALPSVPWIFARRYHPTSFSGSTTTACCACESAC